MSHQIPLTRGKTALIDDSDYDQVSQSKWLFVGSGYAGRFVTRTAIADLDVASHHLEILVRYWLDS